MRVNDALAAINGVPAEQHVGRTLREVVPTLAPMLEPVYRRVLETGEPFVHVELTGEAPGEPGHERHWLSSYYPVRDADARVVGMGAVVNEITERKRAELALQASEERLSFLVEASRILASTLDVETTLRQVTALAVPELADWCTLDVVRAGAIERLAISHVNEEKVETAWMIAARYPQQLEAEGGPGAVIGSGESQLIPEITDAMLATWARDEEHLELLRALGVRSYLCVPLRTGGQTLGALTLYTAESERRVRPRPTSRSPRSSAGVRRSPSRTHGCTSRRSRPRARPRRLLRSSTRSCRPRRSASRSTTTSSGSSASTTRSPR